MLTPCVDYAIVFCRLAGARAEPLMVVPPAPMLLQMAMLPVLLLVFIGPQLEDIIGVGRFVEPSCCSSFSR